MNDIAQTVDDARTVKIDARSLIVLQRIITSAFAERLLGKAQSVTAERLKEWMTGRDPFQAVLFGGLSVRRQPRITGRQRRQLPIGLAFVSFENRRRSTRVEGVRQ